MDESGEIFYVLMLITVWFVLFYGDPDIHDLVIEYLKKQ